MKNLAVSLFCVLVFFPAFAGAQAVSADPENQTESATVPVAPANKPNPATRQRPHMIELTSANWQPLKRSEKFNLFARDMIHWDTHVSIAFDAGLSFATKDRPFLGNGARGYFTRYGLNAADEANFTFFTGFFFPSIFHEDPRYIPRDSSTTKRRLAYAVTRGVVTRSDCGSSEMNFSNIVGMLVATSTSSAMYSSYSADVGVRGNFVAYGYNMGTEAAFDILKEFWPDVARKMKVKLWLRNLVRASLRDYVRVS